MNTKKDIVKKAMEIIQRYGKNESVEGVSEKVEVADIAKFKILFATPSSGVELLPGLNSYHVNIWSDSKKVFSETSLLDSEQLVKGNWVADFMKLA